MEKKFLDWNYVDLAIEKLAKDIKESNLELTHIYGLPRGGLIPAVMLSHKLGLPLIPVGMALTNKVLVVDDICDSGVTLRKYSCPMATLHTKLTAEVQPTFYFEIVKDEWIVYPWENKDSVTVQNYLQ